MIAEFSLKTKPQNKKAHYIFIAFLVGAVAAGILYIYFMKIEKYHGLVGLLTMMLVIAAIFMYTRYIAAQYYYDVTLPGDTPLFVVRHKIGKRETVMCRIELASIVSVEKQTRAERKGHKTPADLAVYNYSPSVDPEITYLITARSRYEKAEITVEANDEFAATLLRYAEIARAEYGAAFDDEE